MTINSDQSVLRAGPGVAPPLARAAGAAAQDTNAIQDWSTLCVTRMATGGPRHTVTNGAASWDVDARSFVNPIFGDNRTLQCNIPNAIADWSTPQCGVRMATGGPRHTVTNGAASWDVDAHSVVNPIFGDDRTLQCDRPNAGWSTPDGVMRMADDKNS